MPDLPGSEDERKGAVIGALRLYLDFINLFPSFAPDIREAQRLRLTRI